MSEEKIELASFKNVSLILAKKDILKDISFSIKSGDIMTIIGPNGAGKSSILKLLIDQYKPTKGIINKKENLKIGYIPQKINIENILPLTVSSFLNKSQKMMDFFDLYAVKDNFLANLSGGELQKVLLARALMRNPDLLLLDETYQGLDVSGVLQFYNLIDKINKETNIAIIMISHDLNIVLNRTDEVICLNKHICCEGKPEKISYNKNFIDLFGNIDGNPLAIYQHNHNHCNHLNGEINNA